jgi:branched-chain amino acid transport system permease protein
VLIYGIVGLGLMLLAGFTGLFSIGHAAFLGVGAYTQAVLANAGVPFPLALAWPCRAVGRGGRGGGLPALRVKGIYLGISTMAFGFIVGRCFARWERSPAATPACTSSRPHGRLEAGQRRRVLLPVPGAWPCGPRWAS